MGEKSDCKLPPNNNETHPSPLPTTFDTSLIHTHTHTHITYINSLSITNPTRSQLQEVSQFYLISMSGDRLRVGGIAGAGERNIEFKNCTHTLACQSVCPVPLLGSYLELSLAACDLIGYSCHAAGAYHIIHSDVHFHPIRFPFVLDGCSDANLFNRAHFHFPL